MADILLVSGALAFYVLTYVFVLLTDRLRNGDSQ